MSVTIGNGRKYLEIRVANSDEVYQVPLLGSLPITVHQELAKVNNDPSGDAATEWFLKFFSDHTSADFINSLTLDDLKTLMRAWKEESEEASGVTMGES